MIYSEAYFTNIKSQIAFELRNAKTSIIIAMAWFTDKDLFAILIEKAKKVRVELVLYRDEINIRDAGLDLERLTRFGGKLYLIGDRLMHHKFCILDDKITLTGSYNWTYKASQENDENIVIIRGDYDLANSYTEIFRKLTGQQPQTPTDDIGKISRRLKIILNLIELGELEETQNHVSRLRSEDSNKLTEAILILLENRDFKNAIDCVNEFLQQHQRLATYQDPEIDSLKLEIRVIEYRLLAIDNELAETEKNIANFNNKMLTRLGPLMEELYKLKKDYWFKKFEASQNKQENNPGAKKSYDKASKQYENFINDQESEKQKVFFELTIEEQKTLKELYRSAAMLCHPDKFESEFQKAKAGEIFMQLKEAYEKQDYKKVKEIYSKLKMGWLEFEEKQNNKVEFLKARLQELRLSLEEKEKTLQEYRNTEVFKFLASRPNLDNYFEDKERELLKELNIWQLKISRDE